MPILIKGSGGAQEAPVITVSSSGLITAKAGDETTTKQLDTQAAQTVMPGTSLQTAVFSGKYTTGVVAVAGDSNLTSENIKSGVSIFGVNGSMNAGGSLYQTTVQAASVYDAMKIKLYCPGIAGSNAVLVGLSVAVTVSFYNADDVTIIFSGVMYNHSRIAATQFDSWSNASADFSLLDDNIIIDLMNIGLRSDLSLSSVEVLDMDARVGDFENVVEVYRT